MYMTYKSYNKLKVQEVCLVFIKVQNNILIS